jgi:hypothetical protein
MMFEAARKNYNILTDLLNSISYKPGWNIIITEEHNDYSFTVTVSYEGYESDNAVFFPLAAEDRQVTAVRARLGRSSNQTIRQPEKRCFSRRFDMIILDRMEPEQLIRYIIFETIKQTEMLELERWFKVEGDTVFG